MPKSNLIRCPGCNVVAAANRSACSGCGRCLNCGDRRAQEIKECPKCDVPYCDCCGTCSGCGGIRYSDVDPCICGHPDDQEKLESLIRYHAVHGAEPSPPLPTSCVVALTVFGLTVVFIAITLISWLK